MYFVFVGEVKFGANKSNLHFVVEVSLANAGV